MERCPVENMACGSGGWLVVDRHNHVTQSTDVPGLLLAPAVPIIDKIGANAGKEMLIACIGGGEGEDCTWGQAVEPLEQ